MTAYAYHVQACLIRAELSGFTQYAAALRVELAKVWGNFV